MSTPPPGSGPLHAAALNNNLDIIDLLMSANANVNATNSLGQTALHISAQYGYIDIVRSLLNAGADKNIRDNDGYLAMDLARDHARIPASREHDDSIG